MFVAALKEAGDPPPARIRERVEAVAKGLKTDERVLARVLAVDRRVVTLKDARGMPVLPPEEPEPEVVRFTPREFFLLCSAGFVDRDEQGARLNHAAEVFYRRMI